MEPSKTAKSCASDANSRDTHLFFSCSSLCDCSCQDPDDWSEPLSVPHDLDHFPKDDQVQVVWDHNTKAGDFVATVLSATTLAQASYASSPQVCTFCDNPLPLDKPEGLPISKRVFGNSQDRIYSACRKCYERWKRSKPKFWKDTQEPDEQPDIPNCMEELNLKMQHEGKNHKIQFRRLDANHSWTLVARPRFDGIRLDYRNSEYLPIQTDPKTRKSQVFPCQIILLSDFPDIRTAKVHAELRLEPLRAIQYVQDIICHMVEFNCKSCHGRFPAFHPEKTPPFQLDVLRHCSNDVAEWDEIPPLPFPTPLAPKCHGRCKGCVDSLKKVENDACLRGVAVFSARNQQLPLYKFPAEERETLLDWTILQLFKEASILESMLVALSHMQVSVCMFDGRRHSTGISRFRKNNICFPQRLSELQQHEIFVTDLQVNDIVNVPGLHASSDASFGIDA